MDARQHSSTFAVTPVAQRLRSSSTIYETMGARSVTSPPPVAAQSPASGLQRSLSSPAPLQGHHHTAVPVQRDTATTGAASVLPHGYRQGICSPRSVASSSTRSAPRQPVGSADSQRPHRVVHATSEAVAATEFESAAVTMSAGPLQNRSFHMPPAAVSILGPGAENATPTSDEHSARRKMISRDASGRITSVNGVAQDESTLRGGSSTTLPEMGALATLLISMTLLLLTVALMFVANASSASAPASPSTVTPAPTSCTEPLCPATLRIAAVALSIAVGGSCVCFVFLCRRRVVTGRRRIRALAERGLVVSPATATSENTPKSDDLLATGTSDSGLTKTTSAVPAAHVSPITIPLSRHALMQHDRCNTNARGTHTPHGPPSATTALSRRMQPTPAISPPTNSFTSAQWPDPDNGAE